MLLFHGDLRADVRALPVHERALVPRAARAADSRRRWALWALACSLHRDASVRRARARVAGRSYVVLRGGVRRGVRRRSRVVCVARRFRSGAATSCSRAGSTSASAAAGEAGGPFAVLEYLARRRRLHRRHGTRRARRPARPRAPSASCCSCGGTGAARLSSAACSSTPVARLRARDGSAATASPESRHLIFVLPFFALLVALALVELARRSAPGSPSSRRARRARRRARSRWGTHKTRRLYVGEPRVRAARARGGIGLARVDEPPDDVLFGYDPLFLGRGSRTARSRDDVVPRADTKLARVCAEAHRRSRSAAASGCSTRATRRTSRRG